jgi:hypothetical protein
MAPSEPNNHLRMTSTSAAVAVPPRFGLTGWYLNSLGVSQLPYVGQ